MQEKWVVTNSITWSMLQDGTLDEDKFDEIVTWDIPDTVDLEHPKCALECNDRYWAIMEEDGPFLYVEEIFKKV